MCREINITESEWKVMEALWAKPQSTIKEICAVLTDTQWGYSTIRTLVLRLCGKGAIGADTTTGNYKYYPLVERAECTRKETKHFLDRIYHGSVKMMISALVKDSSLNPQEMDDLMAIIEKIEKTEKGKQKEKTDKGGGEG